MVPSEGEESSLLDLSRNVPVGLHEEFEEPPQVHPLSMAAVGCALHRVAEPFCSPHAARVAVRLWVVARVLELADENREEVPRRHRRCLRERGHEGRPPLPGHRVVDPGGLRVLLEEAGGGQQ